MVLEIQGTESCILGAQRVVHSLDVEELRQRICPYIECCGRLSSWAKWLIPVEKGNRRSFLVAIIPLCTLYSLYFTLYI